MWPSGVPRAGHYNLSVFRHLRIVLTTGRGDGTPRAIRSRFSEQTLWCPGEKSDFSSFAIKRLLSTRPCGGPYDASRVWWRAPISFALSLSRSPFLFSFFRSFSLARRAPSVSRSRGVTAHFCAVAAKKSAYSCANLLRVPSVREIRLLVDRNGARASPFSLLCAPSRQSPIGSSLVITAAVATIVAATDARVLPPLFPEIFTTLLSSPVMEHTTLADRAAMVSRARETRPLRINALVDA